MSSLKGENCGHEEKKQIFQKKRRSCKTIEVTNMRLGISNPKEIDLDYFHLKFNKINRIIQIIGFERADIQESTSQNPHPPDLHYDRAQPQQKYVIKRQNIRRVELDSKNGIIVIEFKQALHEKYYAREWRPKQVINNSRIVLDIILNNQPHNLPYQTRSRLTTQNCENSSSNIHFEYKVNQQD